MVIELIDIRERIVETELSQINGIYIQFLYEGVLDRIIEIINSILPRRDLSVIYSINRSLRFILHI